MRAPGAILEQEPVMPDGGNPMSEQGSALDNSAFKTAMESADASSIDPVRQFKVVSYVAMGVAAPFVIGHLLIGVYGFPAFANLFATANTALPWPSALLLGLGWFAGPLWVLIDVATFWLLYRLAQRWWIGLLFTPVFIYLMMSAFMGFLLYIPLFPLITLVK
jgi:hypothetical protein